MVLVAWLVMLMGVMGSTAEVFFVPPLTLLSDTLKLSPVGGTEPSLPFTSNVKSPLWSSVGGVSTRAWVCGCV